MGLGAICFTALAISATLTVVAWYGGLVRSMVDIQDRRQKRLGGRPNIQGAEWGTGGRATVSFTLAIWFMSFGITFFGLLIWT